MSKKVSVEYTATIKLEQALETCRRLMKAEQERGVRQTPLFLGPPGQGKSAIIEQLVDELNTERNLRFAKAITDGLSEEKATELAGPEWVCVSYRLAQCDPTDLKGVPVYLQVGDAEMCSFAPPRIFPMEGIPNSADGKNVVIFLDELPQANQSIQNLAANIIDGKVGDYTIDMKRSFIVCAGNRRQDRAATFDIPTNVAGRLIHFDVKTSFAEWESWAIKQKLNPMVIGFLKDRTSQFNETPPEHATMYGTPRSWHKLACQIDTGGSDWFDEKGMSLFIAQGTVGIASATQFFQFAKATMNQFSIDKIMAGGNVEPPSSNQKDIMFSLALEGTYRLNNWIEEVVNDPKYSEIPANHVDERTEMFVKLLGPTKVKGINNLYKWFIHKNIDPAFSVLLNKYQSEKTANNFRVVIATHPMFREEAGKAYEQIQLALIAQR